MRPTLPNVITAATITVLRIARCITLVIPAIRCVVRDYASEVIRWFTGILAHPVIYLPSSYGDLEIEDGFADVSFLIVDFKGVSAATLPLLLRIVVVESVPGRR